MARSGQPAARSSRSILDTAAPLSALVAVLLATLSASPEQVGAQAAQRPTLSPSPTVVYLVRHAERAEDGTDDPPISEEGQERARLVARMLTDADITRIYSTDYRRTRATATPLSEALGVAVEPYDGRDLDGLARKLRAEGGRHLVVGHSNTTPALVRALGGDPGAPIDEAEYDRLYILTLTGETVSTVLIRFGALAPS